MSEQSEPIVPEKSLSAFEVGQRRIERERQRNEQWQQAERNVAVGRAAGLNVSIFDYAAEGPRCVIDNRRVFEPLTDLNAAFEAAEKALRLEYGDEWGEWFNFGTCWNSDNHSVVEWRADFRGSSNTQFGSTPALAICAAILELHGAK